MKLMELFYKKANDPFNQKTPTIVFLGDSVTQGCFDVYIKDDGNIETFFDKNSAYHNYIGKIFEVLYPSVPVNIINAGISGDNAVHGYERLERDVIKFQPDLTVVCFGLNDSMGGLDGLETYASSLEKIFIKLKENGSEVIFMTPNMMNTKISCHLLDDRIRAIAEDAKKVQTEGVLEAFVYGARKVAEKNGVKVCDVYAKWKALEKNGVDTTELLANRINHPTEKMNWLFAYSLVETMFLEDLMNLN